MLLYNVSVTMDKDIETEWLQWMKEIHIPEVMATGCFLESLIYRLLHQPSGDDPTYVIQYRCESQEKLNTYFEKFADALRDKHNGRYKNRFVAFRTVMEEVDRIRL